jgi:prepilin-type N-terminal cleavage/methylation domain-containing protein
MRQRGFSLVETLIAVALLSGALVTLAQFVGTGVQSGAAARARAQTALMAEQKMEQLRVLPWSSIAASGGGVEYLDGSGRVQCPGAGVPCGDAVYVRRWRVTPASFADGIVILDVDVRLVGTGHGGTTLATARARRTP